MIICDYCTEPLTDDEQQYTITLPGLNPGTLPSETGATQIQLHMECCDAMTEQIKKITGKRPKKPTVVP